MKAAWCRAPGIYGQEHLGKHGKGRRRGGGGVGGGAAESGTDMSRGGRRRRGKERVKSFSFCFFLNSIFKSIFKNILNKFQFWI